MSMRVERIPLLLVALAVSIGVVLFAFSPAIPQDPAYHLFADGRRYLGIPNALNVLSNLPFIAVGAAGLVMLGRRPVSSGLLPAYAVFFAGILLTGFGSGYYHLAPANGPLVFDRLPMTIGFAGLFSIVIGEFVSRRGAHYLLVSLLLVFVTTVVYWAVTESRGAGDLRPYALAQFVPMLLTVVIVATQRPAAPLRGRVALMIGLYFLAKLAEYFDAAIFAAGHVVSGHTLKHLLAAAAPAALLPGWAGADEPGLAKTTRANAAQVPTTTTAEPR